METLTPKQQKALTALLNSNTLTEAAKRAGIERKTLYRYMTDNNEFATAYNEIRTRQLVTQLDDLRAQRQKALDTISEIMNDAEAPAQLRLKAAHEILAATDAAETRAAEVAYKNINKTAPMFDSIDYSALDEIARRMGNFDL